MLKKFGIFLSNFSLVFGLVGILMAFIEKDISVATRIFYAVFGLIICLIAKVQTFRQALISFLFLLVSISYIFSVISGNMPLSATTALAFIFFLSIAIILGYRAAKKIRFVNISRTDLNAIDAMSGLEFEEYTGSLLRKLGYTDVTVTKSSGDQGIDVLATKNGLRYAIQCKNYRHRLDNTPVQEAYTGMKYYGCDRAAVITNSTFTQGARELANATGVELWDRDALARMINQAKFKTAPAKNQKSHIENAHNDRTIKSSYIPEPDIASELTSEVSQSFKQNYANMVASGNYHDPMLQSAVDVIFQTKQASVSTLQRHLRLGYARCARIIDEMEALGIVGPFEGSNPRKILISKKEWENMQEVAGDTLPF